MVLVNNIYGESVLGEGRHSALKYLWPGVSAYFSFESFFSTAQAGECDSPGSIFSAAWMALPASGPIHPVADVAALPSEPPSRSLQLSLGRLCTSDKNQRHCLPDRRVSSVQLEKYQTLHQDSSDRIPWVLAFSWEVCTGTFYSTDREPKTRKVKEFLKVMHSQVGAGFLPSLVDLSHL